jgi:endoglucanase
MNKYINAEMKALLERMVNANGGAGDEGNIRDIIIEEIKSSVDDIHIDQLGNLIAHKKATASNPVKLMVATHMDEVALIVVDKDDKGFLEVRPAGGINSLVLPAKPVVVGEEQIPGIFSARTVHLTSAAERSSTIGIEKLRVVVSPGKVSGVNPGDYVYFATKYEELGDSIAAKALDDRVGCVNLIWLLKHAPANFDFYGVFTVQEELGLRGAKVAAYQIQPELAFAFDTTPAIDPPFLDEEEVNVEYNTKAGFGPAIYTVDRGQFHNPKIIRFILEVAEENGILCQLRQPGGGGTDSTAIHLTAAGILSQSISVPVRYLHTPCGMMKISDWEATLNLLDAIFQKLSPEIVKEFKNK